MYATAAQIDEAVSRFGVKTASSLAREAPEVAKWLLHRTARRHAKDAVEEHVYKRRKHAAGEHEGLRDVVLGDIAGPVYPVVEGWRHGGPLGAGKSLLGSSAGIAAGGTLGYGLGRGLEHLGLNPQVLGVPLSTILTGLGATIGGVHGLNWARGR